MGRPKIEIFEGKKGLFYFRVKAGNGEIIAQSEGYTRRSSAEYTAMRLDDIVWNAKIVHIR